MNTNISFINHVTQVKTQLDLLYQRALDEKSQFTTDIGGAKISIDKIFNTYHEVMHRDIQEEHSYQPPRSVK
tara:strand:+ start:1956 stop:2171 length:216 start_codon:yes stop_codon:yes gene_type:complete